MKKVLAGLGLLLSVTFINFASAQLTDSFDTSANSLCTTLSYNMLLGSRDSRTSGQVTDLQSYLQAAGYLQVDPTGYFGSATRAAVISFQNTNGIPPTGQVGPLTRSRIQAISCNTTGTSNVPMPALTAAMASASDRGPVVFINGTNLNTYGINSVEFYLNGTYVTAVSSGSVSVTSATQMTVYVPSNLATGIYQVRAMTSRGGSNFVQLSYNASTVTSTNNYCSSGYTFSNGSCVYTGTSCGSGYALINGSCVYSGNTTGTCPSGYTLNSNGTCIYTGSSANSLPVISSVSQNQVRSGDTVSFYGSNLDQTYVAWGSNMTLPDSFIQSSSPYLLTFTVPSVSPGTYSVSVQKKANQVANNTQNTVSMTVLASNSATCGAGYTLTNGTCVYTGTTTTCATGYTLVNGSCVYGGTTTTCVSGYTLTNGQCVYTGTAGTTVTCSAGYTLVNGVCQTTATAQPTLTSATVTATDATGMTVSVNGTNLTAGNLFSVELYQNGVISAQVYASSVNAVTATSLTLKLPNSVAAGTYQMRLVTTVGATNYATLTVPASGGTSSTGNRNIVAADQATCNATVVSIFGYQVGSCSIGGGCDGANAQVWGICINPVTKAVIPQTQAAPPTSASFNLSSITVKPNETFTVAWTGTNNPTSYKIKWDNNPNPIAVTASVWSNTATSLGWPAGTGHAVYVQACNQIGCSSWSYPLTVTVLPDDSTTSSSQTGNPSVAPSGAMISITPVAAKMDQTVTITWSASNFPTRYEIRLTGINGLDAVRDVGSGNRWDGTPTTLGVIPGTYGFSVRGCNAAGCGGWSATMYLVVQGNTSMSTSSQGIVLGAMTSRECTDLSSSMLYNELTDAKTNGEVTKLQKFLVTLGLLKEPTTGYYGRLTADAVTTYQTMRGIESTGYVGALTKAAIKKETCN